MKNISSKYKAIIKHLSYLIVALTIGSAIAYAGTLTPPGAPADTMYTLDNIYNLATGATSTIGSGSIPATPGSVSPTFHDLTQVYTALSTQISNLSSSTIATGTTAFGITGTKLPSKLLQTFTSNDYCVNNAGSIVSCVGSGEDGQYSKGQAHSYTDNGDGTITDNNTGLMWQKCSVGLSGTNCSTGTATLMTFGAATSTCISLSLAGHSDWRLPNVNELFSIVDNQFSPAIDGVFSNTYPTASYWSSSLLSPSSPSATALVVFFGQGVVPYNGAPFSNNLAVRCVRGG